MTEQQQACAELARRMGITIEKRWQHVTDSSWCLYDLRLPGGTYLGAHCGSIEEAHALLPDYFTDAETSRELVVWLAKQECTVGDQDHECYGDGLCLPFGRFIALVSNSWAVDRFCFNGHRFEVSLSGLSALLTLEPPTVARAACKALGIKVSE